MAVTYLWAVNGMSCYPEHEGHEDVVFNVQWCCNALEDGIGTATYGSTDVTLKPDQPFTPYDNLTIEQVIGWVKEELGSDKVAEQEAQTLALLEEKKAPPKTVSLPLPWNIPAPAPEPIPEPVLEPV